MTNTATTATLIWRQIELNVFTTRIATFRLIVEKLGEKNWRASASTGTIARVRDAKRTEITVRAASLDMTCFNTRREAADHCVRAARSYPRIHQFGKLEAQAPGKAGRR